MIACPHQIRCCGWNVESSEYGHICRVPGANHVMIVAVEWISCHQELIVAAPLQLVAVLLRGREHAGPVRVILPLLTGA
jgi:hypothetical protein